MAEGCAGVGVDFTRLHQRPHRNARSLVTIIFS